MCFPFWCRFPALRAHTQRLPSTSCQPSLAYDSQSASMVAVGDYLRPLMLKDLRTQCRARGLNPGGSREALCERVGEHMTATQDLCASQSVLSRLTSCSMKRSLPLFESLARRMCRCTPTTSGVQLCQAQGLCRLLGLRAYKRRNPQIVCPWQWLC